MLLFSTKTQKERKGLGTSPFGALRLTTVPIPCVSIILEMRSSLDYASPVARLSRVLFSVFRFPFSGAR